MKRKILSLIFMLIASTSVVAQEPYAVLSENNTMLTFYYDDNMESRGGMGVGPFETWNAGNRWKGKTGSITTVVFDASFASCTSITSTANWFKNCSKLTTITGIENLKTDNVTGMGQMFMGCNKLTSIDVSHFNTSNVTEIGYMFAECKSLTSLDLSNFNTSNVKWMCGLVMGCTNLTSINVSSFDTSKAAMEDIGFTSMFENCTSLTSLDLSNFVTTDISQFTNMFKNCSNLTAIYCNDIWAQGANPSGSNEMFSGCKKLTGYNKKKTNIFYARPIEYGGYFTANHPKVSMEPVVEGSIVDFSSAVDENTNLNGHVVGNIYYCIGSDDGGYDSAGNCIVVNKPTDANAINGKDISSEEFLANYTGIVFTVPPGKGSVKIEAEEIGNMKLDVKFGSDDATSLGFVGKQKNSFSYDVPGKTYVYIFGVLWNNARGTNLAASIPDALKLYSVEIVSATDGIETIGLNSRTDDTPVYNLNGQRISKFIKGIYIKNGKKYLVK